MEDAEVYAKQNSDVMFPNCMELFKYQSLEKTHLLHLTQTELTVHVDSKAMYYEDGLLS